MSDSIERLDMNTPTPAQALGKVLYSDPGVVTEWDAELEAREARFYQSAVNFIRQHGQHFAGLESRCESLARSLQMSEELRATSEGNLIRWAERAESAEARVRELEAQRDSEHE